MPRKIRILLLALLAGTTLATFSWGGDGGYGLKANCLYNFAKFVTWPDKAFAGADAPLVIGVLGQDPFGKVLDDTVEGKSIGGHPIKVKRFGAMEPAVKKCHLLFVCLSEKDKVGEVLEALKGASVLTVSEADGFSSKGGCLLLDMQGSKVALQVNVEAARKAGLDISTKLLQVCKIYKGDD